jgi:serine phosphatase RsbU (regulator of sigma subunit)
VARVRPESGGLGLAARFALTTFCVLLVVVGLGAWALFSTARDIADRYERDVREDALVATASANAGGIVERASSSTRSQSGVERSAVVLEDGRTAVEFRYGRGDESARLVVVDRDRELADELFQLVVAAVALVVLVASIASWILANRVARPLRRIVDDVRTLAQGGGAQRYRERVKGGGEVVLLARALDRVGEELAVAHRAELELGLRERELELAEQVREALLPLTTPLVPDYDVGGMHLPGHELSGVFHDFYEYGDGRVGLLVCEVLGEGVPAAIVGAIARTYLRGALTGLSDVGEAFAVVNRELARDLPRGVVVTALFAVLQPEEGRATVACAGHRLPLVRTSAADGKLRVFQPEGVALGLDAGPVFERTLAVQDLEIAPGDRLVLATSGAVTTPDADGQELGERGYFTLLHQAASAPTHDFLRTVRRALEDRTGDEPRRTAISLVTVRREPAAT